MATVDTKPTPPPAKAPMKNPCFAEVKQSDHREGCAGAAGMRKPKKIPLQLLLEVALQLDRQRLPLLELLSQVLEVQSVLLVARAQF